MLRVKVELEPFGMTIGGKQLAEIRIWNSTGKGLTTKHNYEYEVYEPTPLDGEPIMKRGSITGYDRKQPVLNLVNTVLQDLDILQ
jgi:hypothetical protein